ncbi:MAG: UDP-glucose/GDP-mannose dehydrogenase family protein [Deltaproteobacteria bacterium]|jgi:UDPglucose 6-dehydrogenase|nr:UDP-glucose/GDP-mannose dehydrogenase family protein [Deltaproteobacteria bacterium]
MKICMVGTGYVGLVSSACFAEMGNDVYCIDNNRELVERLRAGHIHIFEPGLEPLVRRNHAEGRLNFSTELAEGLDGVKAVFICVGTPSRDDGSCDLGYVRAVAREIGQKMTAPLVLVDKSTVPVGTADLVRSLVAEELAARGLDLEFHVVSNPEFLKEGDAVNDFMKPDRVIIGSDSEAAVELMRDLYQPFARSRDKFIPMRVRSAEMTKYAANCMLATKISFINEIAGICEQVGADVRDVRTGIGSDHRIGYHFIYPGMGYGGSCFPKDVKALINTAREYSFAPQLLQAVDAVNDRQKLVMARRIADYFEPQGGVRGKTLALWGLAFKANTDDLRESSPVAAVRWLTARGMKARIFDPVAGPNGERLFADEPLVRVVHKQYAALEGADALLVATEWNQFRTPDFDRIKRTLSAPLIFDGRNLYQPAALARQGFAYFCIGRK